MIAAVIVALLAIGALVFVVAPIGRTRTTLEDGSLETDAEEKKRVALTGILDLEEERDAGKLSDDEFAELRLRYERDAIEALNELDGKVVVDDALEREIAEARQKLRCGTCGAPRSVDSARCPSCGSSY